MTAAPVPSLSVDNMLEEVAVPHLDADAKRDRASRKASWSETGKEVTATLKDRFGANGGGARSLPPGLPAHLASHLAMFTANLPATYLEAAIGGMPAKSPRLHSALA